MRKLYFLVPGTGGKFACGGLWAELKTFELAKKVCSAELVTYKQRENNTLFLDDLIERSPFNLEQITFVIGWGFDVPKIAQKLSQCHLIYHAHSAGYGFTLPANIPIITVSKNTMGYWGQKSPNSLIYYLPNQISPEFYNLNLSRDIDVLVQTRKSSEYLIKQLIPALKQKCNVYVVDGFVADLAQLFNRTKVYLYDSAEYWAQQGVSEGFGLQPMEAMACGCHVFSSINGGLSDYLDPGFNCQKIAGYSQEYDIKRILEVVNQNTAFEMPAILLNEYREENILARLNLILTEIDEFFDFSQSSAGNIANLTNMRIMKLNAQRVWKKLTRR
ncbi:glycosyltransferase [Merismopedia glauca]|uniref:Glycosyltransferase n=1 Tax=Merismopedia glauca CCAP 1448/3 TaxID=1296344 RepID=A0A2T1C871_9CYAN|nr:glycosyltransferase [Merismopedia glauca]PSB04343.1 glycosyltransferase [Merismopedia glauca CCAP 1448/3]